MIERSRAASRGLRASAPRPEKRYRRTLVRLEFVYVAPRSHRAIYSKLLPLATVPGAMRFVRAGLVAMRLTKGQYGECKWQLKSDASPLAGRPSQPARAAKKRGAR